MEIKYFKTPVGIIKFVEEVFDIVVFALVLVVHYHQDLPLESSKSKALLACSIIGFILTDCIVIGRLFKVDKNVPMPLVETGVGIIMAIFNFTAAGFVLEEAVNLPDTINLIILEIKTPKDIYLAAGACGIITGATYLMDAGLAITGFIKKK